MLLQLSSQQSRVRNAPEVLIEDPDEFARLLTRVGDTGHRRKLSEPVRIGLHVSSRAIREATEKRACVHVYITLTRPPISVPRPSCLPPKRNRLPYRNLPLGDRGRRWYRRNVR